MVVPSDSVAVLGVPSDSVAVFGVLLCSGCQCPFLLVVFLLLGCRAGAVVALLASVAAWSGSLGAGARRGVPRDANASPAAAGTAGTAGTAECRDEAACGGPSHKHILVVASSMYPALVYPVFRHVPSLGIPGRQAGR